MVFLELRKNCSVFVRSTTANEYARQPREHAAQHVKRHQTGRNQAQRNKEIKQDGQQGIIIEQRKAYPPIPFVYEERVQCINKETAFHQETIYTEPSLLNAPTCKIDESNYSGDDIERFKTTFQTPIQTVKPYRNEQKDKRKANTTEGGNALIQQSNSFRKY